MERTLIENLNSNDATLVKQTITTINGKEIIQDVWKKAYVNSTQGRLIAQEEIPEPYLSAVMIVWGDIPTTSDD